MNFEEEIKTLRENVDKYVREITEKIEKLKKEKQKEKEKEEAEISKNRFWKPTANEKYFYLANKIEETTNLSMESDFELVEYANCYRIYEKELAEKDIAKRKARQIIQRTADQLHGERYEYGDKEDNYVIGDSTFEIYYAEFEGNDIYFKSIELAEKCLKICEKEYKILLGVE